MPRKSDILNNLILIIIFSVPLEGVFADLISGDTIRTPTFFLMVAAALMTLPLYPKILFTHLIKAAGLPLLMIVLIYSILLWAVIPLNSDAEQIKIILQSLVFAMTLFFVARLQKDRRRAVIAFMLGWLILLAFSFYRHDTYQTFVYQTGVVRFQLIAGLDSNKHAAYVGCGLIMAFVFLTAERRRKYQLILLAAIAFGTVVFLMGNSRGAVFSLLATIIVILLPSDRLRSSFQRSNNFIRLVLVACAIAVVLSVSSLGQLLYSSFQARAAQSIFEDDFSTRDDLAIASARVILKHPIGVGMGNSGRYLKHELGSVWDKDPHNEYLRVFMDAGWLGGIIFIIALYKLIMHAYFNIGTIYDKALYAALTFNLINAFGSHNLFYKTTWFFIAMSAFTPDRSKSVATPDKRH